MKRLLSLCMAFLVVSALMAEKTLAFDRCALCENGAPQINPDPPPPSPPPPKRNPCKCQASSSESKCSEQTTKDQGCGGDPVELKGRTLSITRTDFVLKGIIPIRMDFSYRTSGNMVGHFGLGWYFNYDIRINRDETGSYFFRGESGEMRKYAPDGRQLEGAVSKDAFKLNSNGTYTMERYDGLIYEFNSWGLLSFIMDRSGNYLHFTYEDNGTGSPVKLPIYGVSRYMTYTDFFEIAAFDYRLKKIENGLSPNKQSLTFTYNSFGLVDKVVDHASRAWQYQYDPSYGTLIKVINPVGEFVYYTFNPAKPLLPSSYVNEAHAGQDGKSLIVNTYDAAGKISLQTYNGMTFTPTEATPVVAVRDTVVASQTVKKTVVSSVYGSTSVNRDGNGALVSTLTTTYFDTAFSYDPPVLPSETHVLKRNSYTITGPTGSSTTMAIDTAEILNDKGMLVRQRLPDGSYTTYQYDANFRTTQEIRNIYNPILADTQRFFTRRQFLGRLNLATRISEGLIGADSSVVIYEYDPYTFKRRFERKLDDPSNPASAVVTEYRYDALGLLVEKVDAFGRITRYEYDGNSFGSANTVGLGFSTAVTNPAQERTIWTNDLLGNRILERDPRGGTKTTDFDAMNRPTRSCDETEVCTAYAYRDSRMIKREDGVSGGNPGRVTRYEYDNNGRVNREIREMGAGQDFLISDRVYDANDRMVQDSYQGGLLYTYEYDAMGHMIEKSDSAGKAWKTFFDVNGNPYLETDPLGFQTAYVFDAMGRLLKRTDAVQMALPAASRKSETWEYDFEGKPVRHVDALGRISTMAYNGLGEMTRQIGFNGDTTLFTYDSGRLKSARKPEGGLIYFTYDRADRVVRKLSKEGDTRETADTSDYVEETQYDANGRPTRTSVAGKVIRKLGYSPRGQVVRDTNGAGEVRSYTYLPTGEVASAALPNGQAIQYEYDNLGRLTKESDALGILRTVSFATSGRSMEERVPGAGSNLTLFSATGEVIRQQDSSGVSMDYTLDARHLVASSRDATGGTVQYTRDGLGRVIARQDERGFSTYTAYDAIGRIASTKDNEGNTTSYTQQDFAGGSRTILGYPDGLSETGAFDRDGRTLRLLDRMGRETLLRYDMLGRLKEREFADHTKAAYSYFQNGLLRTGQYGGNASEFQYDAAYRPTLHKQTILGETFNVRYAYRMDSNAVHTTYPDGFVAHTYGDVRGRASRVATSTAAVFGYNYSGNLLTSLARSNSVTTAYGYDPSGRMRLISHGNPSGALEAFQYGYDSRGLEIYRKFNHEMPASLAFSYTADGRLQEARRGDLDASNQIPSPIRSQSWSLDSRGNWLTNNADGVAESRTHDGMNRILSAGATGLAYDLAGNLTSVNGLLLSWDQQGRLQSAGANIYTYDGFGRRIAKSLANGTVEKFIHDGQRILYKKISSGPNIRYVFGSPYIDELLYVSKSDGSHYFPLTDALHSVVGIANAAGNLVEQIKYDAYGSFQISDPFGSSLPSSLVGNENYFTGRTYDWESGLYFFRNRYMDPMLGRFISPDPIGWFGGVNLYAYVEDNPANMVDPMGLQGGGGYSVMVPRAGRGFLLTNPGRMAQSPSMPRYFGAGEHAALLELMRQNTFGTPEYEESGNEGKTGGQANVLRDIQAGNGNPIVPARTNPSEWQYNRGPAAEPQLETEVINISEECKNTESIVTLNPNTIRLSQSNVRRTLPEIVESMRRNGWDRGSIDVVRMIDGGLTAIDNTRVVAASFTNTPVRAVVRNWDEPFPNSRGPQYFGNPATWGEAISNRINNQKPAWQSLYPNGSNVTGVHPDMQGFSK